MTRPCLTTLFLFLLSISSIHSQGLYDLASITVIEITFEDSNWDQTLDTYYSQDNGDRLLASCVVIGVPFDSVGVRYKGNATYHASNTKNPLNIKLDYILNQDYEGFETLKLSSGNHDPSFVREVLSYEIARKYCVAPLSNYAKVYVNGSYHGLYTSNENIGGDFQNRYLNADNQNPRVKCNNDVGQGPFSGGSTLEYISGDSTDYYDYYEMDTDHGWTELTALITTLENDPNNIESIINIDRAIWMMAFNNVLCNFDSYIGRKQNYYLCQDDNGIFDPILWDMNESLGGFEDDGSGGGGPGGGPGGGGPGSTSLDETDPDLHAGDDEYPLLALILDNPVYYRMYIAHCKTILEENFANGDYATRAQELQSLIEDAHTTDPNALYTWSTAQTNLNSTVNGSGQTQGAIGITELMDARVIYLEGLTEYTATAPTIANATTQPTSVAPGSTFDLVVSVNNANTVTLGYRDDPVDEFTKVEMFDDGQHNDGAANDGTWGVSLSANQTHIEYYFYADNNNAGAFSPARAQHEFHTLEIELGNGDVVINELMATNDVTAADQDGEFDDWIELYNNTSSSIDLSGYFLSDEADAAMKWEFPAGTTIDGNGYLIVWADNDTDQSGLHAGFKLSADGEAVFLSDPNGNLIDYTYFGPQVAPQTYGRFPNGTGSFVAMEASYAAENDVVIGITQSEMEGAEKIMAFPNPTQNQFTLSWETNDPKQVSVWSLNGMQMHQSVENGNNVQIATDTWPAGIYFARVNEVTLRVVVAH